MPATGYAPWSVIVGEQPTTTKWNILGSNDASFYTGTGINDQAIVWRHLQADMIPTGSIHIYGALAAPSSLWLICDGSAVSRVTYAPLYAVIGVIYGPGDGSTTFNIPNLQGRIPVGKSASDSNFISMGQQGGESSHSLTANEMPGHTHTGNTAGAGNHDHASNTSGQTVFTAGSNNHTSGDGNYQQITWGNTRTDVNGNHGHSFTTDLTGGGAAHNNIQPYTTIQYIIKT